jgi:hypothetical protein
MLSEVLEDAGFDRKKARRIRKQVLEGLVVLCQWQLERIRERERAEAEREPAPRPTRTRRVPVE